MDETISGFRHYVNRYSDNGGGYRGGMRQTARSEFGTRLRQARQDAGLTQAELAKAAGMPLSTLAEAETKGQGSTYTPQLAAACRVSPGWLATGEGAIRSAQNSWPFDLLTPDDIAKLSTKQLRMVEKLAFDLLEIDAPGPSEPSYVNTSPSGSGSLVTLKLTTKRKPGGRSSSSKENPSKSGGG